MATVGQQLTTPETGWKRYEESNIAFKFEGSNWVSSSNAAYSGGSGKYTITSSLHSVKFKFFGSKIRIISYIGTDRNPSINLSIDGANYTYSASGVALSSALLYEKTDLSLGEHTVEIYSSDANNSKIFEVDAIDIDATGRLLHPDEVTDPKDLAIGKRIRCNYKAASNVFGTFAGLGKETKDFIPTASSATPDGDFYFIMVEDWNGEKRLIADRNIQHSISWNTLNTAGAVDDGLQIGYDNLIPLMTSNTTPSGVVETNSIYSTSYDAWKAFDGTSSTWNTQTGLSEAWLSYEFGSAKKVCKYSIQATPSTTPADINSSPKNWTFDAWDGNQWIPLHVITNSPAWSSNEIREYTFINNNQYIKYRIKITANNGGSYMGLIQELKMFEQSFTNFAFSTRLLTGGTTSTDKDNEWDQYIVNSTLNGTITAGDPTVWNHVASSMHAFTSTSNSGASRVLRGYPSISGWGDLASSGVGTDWVSNTIGYRPMLLVESLFTLITKYLFQDGTDLKKYTTVWETVGQSPATEELFQLSGMDDLSIITDDVIKSLLDSNPKVLAWYNDQTIANKTQKLTAIPNPKLVKANGNIDLSKADVIDSFTLTATQSGTGIVKVIASIDDGTTWKSYYNNAWVDVNALDLADVKTKGMDITTFNTLADWNNLLSSLSVKKIRFAYYLELLNSTDLAETDALAMQIDMKGKWRTAIHGTDYDYFYPSNITLTVEFYSNGDFKINY